MAADPRAASPLRLSLGTPFGPLSIEPRSYVAAGCDLPSRRRALGLMEK